MIDTRNLINNGWIDSEDDPNLIPLLPIKRILDQLSDEERMEIFIKYCKHCGSKNVNCKCWNDE